MNSNPVLVAVLSVIFPGLHLASATAVKSVKSAEVIRADFILDLRLIDLSTVQILV